METIAFASGDYHKHPCSLDCGEYIQRDGLWLTFADKRYAVHSACMARIGTPIYDQLLKERE